MTDAPRRGATIAAALGAFACALTLGYLLRMVFTPALLALALAYLLHPLVAWLERRGLPRTAAIAALYASALLAAAGALAAALPRLSEEIADLYQMTFKGEPYADLNNSGAYDPGEPLVRDINGNGRWDRAYLDQAADFVRGGVTRWRRSHGEAGLHGVDWLRRLREGVDRHVAVVARGIAALADALLDAAVQGVEGLLLLLSYGILVPLYLFWFLKYADRVLPALSRICPAEERERLMRVLHRIHASIVAFFRGQIVCGATKGVIVAAGLTLVGTPYGLLLGCVYGFLGIFPYLALLVAFPLIEVVTVLDAGAASVSKIVGVMAVVGVGELVEGAVLVPMLFGRVLGIAPPVLFVSLFLCGQIFGVFGLLAAVPLTATVKILIEEYALRPCPSAQTNAASVPPPDPPPQGPGVSAERGRDA